MSESDQVHLDALAQSIAKKEADNLKLLADNQAKAVLLAEREGVISRQATQIEQQAARIRELEGNPVPPPDPDPDPPPSKRMMYVGACILTTAQAARNKWGEQMGLRSFSDEADGWNTPSRPDGVGLWHHSWKPRIGTLITEAQIEAMFSKAGPFEDDDVAELWHELAVKFRSKKLTRAQLDQVVVMKNDFHAKVVKLREAGRIVWIRTSFTDAAWMWDNKSKGATLYPGNETDPETAAFWGKNIKADLIGCDMDAYTVDFYPNFIAVADNMVAFCTKYGFDGWLIPEVSHHRITGDTNGAKRTAWIISLGNHLLGLSLPPESFMWFDRPWTTGGKTYDLVISTSSTEFSALKQLQAKAAA